MELNAKLMVAEIENFENLDPYQLMQRLTDLSKMVIRDDFMLAYEKSKELQIDIFSFGIEIMHKNYKKYQEIKDDWSTIYQNSKLNLKIKVEILAVGKTVESIQMERVLHENR